MLKSRNVWVNFITMILGVLQAWGVTIGTTGSELLDTFATGDIGLIAIVLVNFINPVMKIFQNKLFNWEFVKSRNFWTNAVTFIFSIITLYSGVDIPAEGAAPIAEAIESGNLGMILSAVGMNLVNYLSHLFEKKEPS